MVLNMDSELQRLICVSVEKMTCEPGSGSRKSKSLDLRKAVLVTHVLQDMRSAYIADDYKVLVNTVCPELSNESDVEKLKRTVFRRDYVECISEDVMNPKKRKFISDDWASGAIERPPRSESSECECTFMTSPYRFPSETQSCLMTCSNAAMSKISQVTHPIPVSINTKYVLSYETSEKDTPVDVDPEEDTPAVSEQVEVTSTNEFESEPMESEVIQCEELLNIGQESPEIMLDTTTVTTYTELTSPNSREKAPVVTCPLPRKKRPLPKEFLDQNVSTESETKRTRVEVSTVTSSSSTGIYNITVTSSPCRLHNTTTATTVTQSTALSRSQAPSQCCAIQSAKVCSAVSSTVCSTTVTSTCKSERADDAKVVVEKMHKSNLPWMWSLPASCTQLRLSKSLMDGVYRSRLADISNTNENKIQPLHFETNLVAVQ